MSAKKLHLLVKVMPFVLIMIIWMLTSGGLSEGAMYKYVDKDGNVVITDNPPPDFKIESDELPPELVEQQKLQLEKEKQLDKKIYQKRASEYDKEKQAKITKARSELDKALADEETYRLNLQQATSLPDRVRWRELLDKQQNVVKEKRDKFREIESQP